MNDSAETTFSKREKSARTKAAGITTSTVNNAIKLLTAAKQLGIQSFILGDFHASFENNKPDQKGIYPAPGAPLHADEDSWFDGLKGPQ